MKNLILAALGLIGLGLALTYQKSPKIKPSVQSSKQITGDAKSSIGPQVSKEIKASANPPMPTIGEHSVPPNLNDSHKVYASIIKNITANKEKALDQKEILRLIAIFEERPSGDRDALLRSRFALHEQVLQSDFSGEEKFKLIGRLEEAYTIQVQDFKDPLDQHVSMQELEVEVNLPAQGGIKAKHYYYEYR